MGINIFTKPVHWDSHLTKLHEKSRINLEFHTLCFINVLPGFVIFLHAVVDNRTIIVSFRRLWIQFDGLVEVCESLVELYFLAMGKPPVAIGIGIGLLYLDARAKWASVRRMRTAPGFGFTINETKCASVVIARLRQ